MSRWPEFDRQMREVDADIAKLERILAAPSISDERRAEVRERVEALRGRQERITREVFAKLTAWDNVLLARHVDRPYTLDYVGAIFGDFVELHGDRRFGDDPAIVAGLGSLDGETVAVIGHQKGRDVKERQFRNFGSGRPEGYRKAGRVMRLAEKLGQVKLVKPDENIRKILEITRLAATFEVFDDVAEAVRVIEV